jgi:hypothetical protein
MGDMASVAVSELAQLLDQGQRRAFQATLKPAAETAEHKVLWAHKTNGHAKTCSRNSRAHGVVGT